MSRLVVSVPTQAEFDYISRFNVEPVLWAMDGPPPRTDLDVAVVPYVLDMTILQRLEGLNLRLVQGPNIGYDGVVENLPAGMIFANAASVHETATAEQTLTLILAAQRGIPRVVRQQGQRHWEKFRSPGLADRTVVIIGVGGVGAAIIERLRPFEVEIVRVASTERDDETGHVYSMASVGELLPRADVVVIAVPLNANTHHLVDDTFLSLMRDDTLLVNIARGGVANTEALVRHMDRLRLALDVFDPEPLPADSPLWDSPNVIVAPHLGGLSTAQFSRHNALLGRQIEHLLAGEEPENVVVQS